MDSDPLDSAVDAQEASLPASQPETTDGSLAGPDAENDQPLDAAPPEDEADDDYEVLPKAEAARLKALAQREEAIARKEAEAARREAQAERQRQVAAIDEQYWANRNGWVRDMDENGWTREKQAAVDKWDRWYHRQRDALHQQDLAERDARANYIARPEFVRKVAEKFGITSKAQFQTLMEEAEDDETGRSVVTAARILAAQNKTAAEERAKKRRAAGSAVTQAVKDHLDTQSANRRASGADSLGGGGSPSVASKWDQMSSREKLAAILAANR